jgi:hypothetical protein
VWFDAGVRLRAAMVGLCVGAVSLGVASRASAQPESQRASEVSLGSLLAGGPRRGDPDIEVFDALLTELRRRVAHAEANGAIEAAAQAVSDVRARVTRRAPASEVSAAKQLAWAALSLADREHALATEADRLRLAERQLAQISGVALSTPLPRIAVEDHAGTAGLAPDFLARADRARADAHVADGGTLRSLHERRVALLAAAAAAEASRILCERLTKALQARASDAERQAAAAARAQREARAAQDLARAAEASGLAAARAFDEACRAAPLVHERAERAAARAEAAVFFVERARLLVAAATALGAEAARLQEAQHAIARAQSALRAPAGGLDAALCALEAGQAVLASVRAPDPASWSAWPACRARGKCPKATSSR